jgi:hypothetical protein
MSMDDIVETGLAKIIIPSVCDGMYKFKFQFEVIDW